MHGSFIIQLLDGLNPYLSVAFLSVFPVGELRLSIPLGILFYKLPMEHVLVVSIFCEIIAVVIVLLSLNKITQFLQRHSAVVHDLLNKILERTRKSFFHKHRAFGNIALTALVAVPLPLTGFWTAALAAWLFEIPVLQATLYISFGIAIAAFLVWLISVGIIFVF